MDGWPRRYYRLTQDGVAGAMFVAGGTPLDFRHMSSTAVLLTLIAALPVLLIAARDRRSSGRLG
ncbi:hypothetical protein ACF08M_35025 [Streptomyces sp. NPDC015032]|uniref:hypothetical protein n=1 Tax=Streptomyces sp. NPDC015032 TaxID=3364937 RepID=UPI0036FEFF13